MSEWSEGTFEIVTNVRKRSVAGIVSGEFGIYFDEHCNSPGWMVTHTGTGMSINGRQPFEDVETAKEFVARVRPLAEWNDIDPESPPDVQRAINEIVDNLNGGGSMADLMQVPPYMGDEAFREFLGEHGCPASLEVVRMRFLGAAVTPGVDADVYLLVEELFDYQMPKLDGEQRVEFLHAFLGLFQVADEMSRQCRFALTPMGEVDSLDGVKELHSRRIDEVAFGFLEGVWQGEDELSLSKTQAAMLTAIEEMARTYEVRHLDILNNEHRTITQPVTELCQEILAIDNSIETATTSLLEDFRDNTSVARPFIKRAAILIDELARAEALPRDAIRQCVERRDEFVPIFLRILRDHADELGDMDDIEPALFFIVHILGELGEQRAFAPLMDSLAGEPERVDEMLGGAITENLPKILISVFDGDTERLCGLMNNPDADEFVRLAAFEAWTYYVAVGRIDRTEAEQYLTAAFETLQPRDDNYVWVAWLEAIAHLGFADLRETVRKAFELGRVSPTILGFDDFDEILDKAKRSDNLVAFLAEDRIAPFTDTIEVLSTWHCFSEEYIRAKAQAKREAARPIQPFQPVHTATNPLRNVGRNDPCPCGSGKKFKKCCLP